MSILLDVARVLFAGSVAIAVALCLIFVAGLAQLLREEWRWRKAEHEARMRMRQRYAGRS